MTSCWSKHILVHTSWASIALIRAIVRSRSVLTRQKVHSFCKQGHTTLAFLLLFGSFLLGCEDDLSARTHYDHPFTLFGTLSPDLDTQSVRVYAIEDFPTLGSDSIDAVVTSRDLTTGESRTWRDSVLVDPNGQHEHIFWSPFRAAYGHVYHLEVTRPSDGVMSYADVRVPPAATLRITSGDDPHVTVRIEGEGIRALTPMVEYVVKARDATKAPILAYQISYQGKEQQIPQGWQVTINMVLDRPWVQSWYNIDAPALTGTQCHAITLRELNFHVLVGDSLWNPPEGRFDPRVLSQPGVLSNVQNGFGFIGGGFRVDEQVFPSRKAVEDGCFAFYNPVQ